MTGGAPGVADAVDLSRTVSHALSHDPAAYGLTLDADGWTPVDSLLAALARQRDVWAGLTAEQLEAVLDAMPRRRHELDAGRIRARYGHSVAVDPPTAPERVPAVLFHGTTRRAWAVIAAEGLKPMERQRVHLSDTVETAERVASRHGADVVILEVDAAAGLAAGLTFWHVGDSTWQVEAVPAEFLRPLSL